MRFDDETRDVVLPVPDASTKKCAFVLIRGQKRLGEVVLEDAVGPDGKAIFEKIVAAYDHFRELKRTGKIT